MNKIKKLKEIAKEIDVTPYWNENPTSETLRRIIKFQREIWENEKEEEVVKSAIKMKKRIWVLINKTPHITKEKERENLNGVVKFLEDLTSKN